MKKPTYKLHYIGSNNSEDFILSESELIKYANEDRENHGIKQKVKDSFEAMFHLDVIGIEITVL